MGDTERALNFEIVTQTDFDPSAVTKSLVEAGRKYDQDAVFLSKVVPDGTPNTRPGVEVYFKERQGVDYAQQITAILRAKGIDGILFMLQMRARQIELMCKRKLTMQRLDWFGNTFQNSMMRLIQQMLKKYLTKTKRVTKSFARCKQNRRNICRRCKLRNECI